MCVKSPGVALGKANARPPELTMRANAPQLPGGGWAQLELTDTLQLILDIKYGILCPFQFLEILGTFFGYIGIWTFLPIMLMLLLGLPPKSH